MTSSGAQPWWHGNARARSWSCPPAPGAVLGFHAGLPGYAPTPLVEAPVLAEALGVGRAFVKDESSRLGLPAFKVLGASWAVHRVLSRRAGRTAVPATLEELRAALTGVDDVELITATDGNHGHAVARMARLLGLAAHIYVPEVVHPAAANAIAAEGAAVTTVAGSYDATVNAAAQAAGARPGAELIQDTAWPGYEQVPAWIVEGYSTLFRETAAQLDDGNAGPAGLVAVPVGVGSLAQAAVVHHRSAGTATPTAVLGVEPDTAACVLSSLVEDRPRTVETATTVMTGLNCGTPSSIAWPYLRAGLDAAVAVTDAQALRAVEDLGASGIAAGPSGAASLAGAAAALTGRGSDDRRAGLRIGHDSVVVLLSTEGATAVTPTADREQRSR